MQQVAIATIHKIIYTSCSMMHSSDAYMYMYMQGPWKFPLHAWGFSEMMAITSMLSLMLAPLLLLLLLSLSSW